MINKEMQQVVAQTKRLEQQLSRRFPAAYNEARRLADNVLEPKKATRREIWERIWDKPLYANAKVEFADRWVEQLKPFMGDALMNWGARDGDFCIEKIGPGTAKESYRLSGRLADDILSRTSVARHRLFRIQGAARALRAMHEEAPFRPFAQQPLHDVVSEVRAAFGEGWGAITVLHALTDFGLAVKPDLHLVRTCRAIGLLDHLVVSDVPNLKQSLEINRQIVCLCETKFGEVSARNLRYLDKLLMEISRCGLLSNPSGSQETTEDIEYLEICKREQSDSDFKVYIEFPESPTALRDGYITPVDLMRLMALITGESGAVIRGDEWPLNLLEMTIDLERKSVKLVAKQDEI